MQNALLEQFVKFCVVGGVGFAVDGGLLFVLVHGDVSPYFARFVSFPCAVLATWWLNSRWTFTAEGKGMSAGGKQFGAYIAVQLLGALTNLAVYVGALRFTGTEAGQAFVAFAFGSAAGLVVNFLGSRFLVFGGTKPSP
jgi:putative flippase GtrA